MAATRALEGSAPRTGGPLRSEGRHANILRGSINEYPVRPQYIPTLDGWRAVAISLVIVSHGLEDTVPLAAKLGALGVNIFFALSGYLICTLLLSEYAETGTISLLAFYRRRIFRILPPALAYLLAVGVLSATGIIALRRGELETALCAANYFHSRSWFTAHYWSLSMEEHFYLFWPAVLALGRPHKAQLVAGVLLVLLVFYRPWAELKFDVSSYQHTDMRLDAFLLPCMLAILLAKPNWRSKFANLLRPWVCVLLFGAVCCLSATAANHPGYSNAQKLFQSAALPLLIVSTVLRPSLLSALLELGGVRWIGRISYSLYLWQQLFLFHERPGPPFIVRLPIIFAFAAASYYLIERPMIRLGHRIARSQRGVVVCA